MKPTLEKIQNHSVIAFHDKGRSDGGVQIKGVPEHYQNASVMMNPTPSQVMTNSLIVGQDRLSSSTTAKQVPRTQFLSHD